jgi:hypothetical protein
VTSAQELERPGHPPGIEIALIPHNVFEEVELAVVNEQRQLAGLSKISLRRQQRDRVQNKILFSRQICRSDRQKGQPR